MLDMRTVLINFFLSNALLFILTAVLWKMNKNRYSGVFLWFLFSFFLSTGVLLTGLRDIIPDFFSIIIGDLLIVSGYFIIYQGMKLFLGMRIRWLCGIILIFLYLVPFIFFTYYRSDISARTLIFTVINLGFHSFSADLLLRRVKNDLRRMTFFTGMVFILYAFSDLARIASIFIFPFSDRTISMMQAPAMNTAIVMLMTMINFGLTFSLVMMLTQRMYYGLQEQNKIMKEHEIEIKSALSEKETLLRELYHRTKNNMQVIISLIDLQSAHMKDGKQSDMLVETKNRIYSMSLVHQKLYETKSLSRLNLKDYIRDLVPLLKDSCKISSGKISVDFDLDDVFVSIDIAIPCGLILNELVTNAFKYAFPDDRSGRIVIRIKNMQNNKVAFEVSDNGIGLPYGYDPGKDGNLGMKNIFSIGERQLQGKVEISSKPGFSCRIEFTNDQRENGIAGN